jgi:hypothetical protein
VIDNSADLFISPRVFSFRGWSIAAFAENSRRLPQGASPRRVKKGHFRACHGEIPGHFRPELLKAAAATAAAKEHNCRTGARFMAFDDSCLGRGV